MNLVHSFCFGFNVCCTKVKFLRLKNSCCGTLRELLWPLRELQGAKFSFSLTHCPPPPPPKKKKKWKTGAVIPVKATN